MSILDILRGNKAMNENEFLAKELQNFLNSDKRNLMIAGERYHNNDHDILENIRTAIGPDGDEVEVPNLPNNKEIDNQYGKAVDQKINYSFSKPFIVETEDETYKGLLEDIFDNRFRRKLNMVATAAMNNGISYIYPYYDDNGNFKFKAFNGFEILPFWKDKAHTELDSFLYYYEVSGYQGYKAVTIKKAEYYHSKGVKFFEVNENGKLVPDVEKEDTTHIEYGNERYNWLKIPLVPFKFNYKEIPLIKRVKSLQDGLNKIISNFANNMEEDAHNTILVIHNYDGADLGEFRRNLATYAAVKVNSRDGSKGGIDTLTIEVNADNYKALIEVFRKAIIENAKALDTKDIKSSGTPNEMNIQSMYSDMDLDANAMELEFKAAFEDLLWFIDNHLANSGQGDYTNIPVEISFIRDIMINQSQTVTDLRNSIGMLSEKTIIEKHPYATEDEADRIESERKTQRNENAINLPGDLQDEDEE